MYQETPRRAGNVGTTRFVQRGSILIPEDRRLALRAKINEYPERFPLDPAFPRPGRRGPSPAPRRQDAPTQTGLPPPDGSTRGAGETPPPPPGPYPDPRDRGGADEIPTSGNIPSPTAEGASSANACLGPGGIHIQRHNEVTTLATDSAVSIQFQRPFVIRYVGFWCDTTSLDVRARLLLASNADIAAGFTSPGVQLDEGAIGTSDFGGVNALQQSYPNKRWTQVPSFIKLIVQNLTAGTITFQWVVNLDWLD
jgi:hypothetical protein